MSFCLCSQTHTFCQQCIQVTACVQVTLVFPESRVMERLFTPEIASFYEKFYEDKCAHLAWDAASGIADGVCPRPIF